MNFFEHQDRARGTTRKLVVLFALAVVSLIFVTTFLVVTVLAVSESSQQAPGLNQTFLASDIFLGVSALVIAVVALGAMFRMMQLRGGGKVVAENLGGRLLNLQTRDDDERKILNVVEEMAIASGMPVPPVYLIEENAINAFAAGFRQEDAVIGITRGSIQQLSRDELQGVIAHEFSHICNGDMKLNIRLIGWLYGIMVIGMIGYFILRGSIYRGSSRGKDNKGGIMFLALGLVIIGYGGTFFGNLIKAAVSRQREFLADASAVQFTRNPDGIGGALKKIGMLSEGSMLHAANASEVSHMLFGQGVKAGFTGLLATHPPLADRIRRIQPGWDGNMTTPAKKPAERTAAEKGKPAAQGAGLGVGLSAALAASSIVEAVGETNSEGLQEAKSLLTSLPAALLEEAHSTLGACLLMHCLIIANTAVVSRDRQWVFLEQNLQAPSIALCKRLMPVVQQLPREQYLTVMELSLPALKQLSEPQVAVFIRDVQKLMQADDKLDLFEWCLFQILQRHLSFRVRKNRAQTSLEKNSSACEVLLSALCHAGHEDVAIAASAFSAGVKQLGLQQQLTLRSKNSTEVLELEQSMQQLQDLQPLQKPRLLKAMVHCIVHDGVIQTVEGELLRAVGAILDCPLPPLNSFMK